MSPRVLNKRTVKFVDLGNTVYVGRPTKFGNPFRIGPDGTREEVIEKFRAWFTSWAGAENALEELRGKDLVCWCAPEPCHADVLLELANG